MRTLRLCVSGVLLAAATLATGIARADTRQSDFESPTYTAGSIHGQDGWSSAGSAGSGCAAYDHAVVPNTYGYAGFGSQSLRISNAVTSGCFGDQTFSRSTVDEAGESGAPNDGMSGGTRQNHFEATWEFASTVPGAEQPGASVVASPDRGDGARMSWVQMQDTPEGLAVNFYDFQVPSADLTGECLNGDFIFTPVAVGLDRTVPHAIEITMDLLDGPGNDIVKVSVDGILLHVGTSWEDYFRECQPPGTRTVDSILFRTGGAAAPDTLGNGFLIDNLSVSTSTDTTGPAITATRSVQPNAAGWNRTDVTVAWDVDDPESEIVSTTGCGTTTLTEETAGTTLTCSATNLLGLTTERSVTVRIDKTSPLTTMEQYLGGDLRGSATDNLSGVVGVSVTWQAVGSYERAAVCYLGCGTTSAKWRATPPQSRPSVYRAAAHATDLAGNIGPSATSGPFVALP